MEAVQNGLGINLAGGTHHAFRERGEGYCVFNDSAIASKNMIREGRVKRVVIIDCDVHQGNGTAAILSNDKNIFTFSIHGRKNFPHDKEISDLDIALEDNISDKHYLKMLSNGINIAIKKSNPDLVIYLAGADPYEDDKFGRLALTKQGLAERDSMVYEFCRKAGLPIAVTMAGGYARDVKDTVDIHFQTVKNAVCMLNH
jgi:acetoin utilization deacetylase AcuC-like enzyme